MRYFVHFSYLGTHYHGWQKQPNASSVQEKLEHSLSMLLAVPVELMGAGRTDAGVHAKKMVAHFDTEIDFDPLTITDRLNAFLPEDISIDQIVAVTQDTHARFTATSRTYEYIVVNRKDPFQHHGAHYVFHPIDIHAMNTAAQMLLGEKDFECFSKSNSDVHTYICDISHAKWIATKDQLIFTITANRFLRNMVRAVVGTLLEIGTGKRPVTDIPALLASKSRSKAGPSVPAKGLYLTQINYPENIYV